MSSATTTAWKAFIKAGGFRYPGNAALFMEWFSARVVEAKTQGYPSSPAWPLIAILIFAVLHVAWKSKLQAPGSTGLPARAVWLWNKPTPGMPAKFLAGSVVSDPKPFLAFAATKNINQVWLDVHEQTNIAKLNSFCAQAKQAGIDVDFMFANDASFAKTAGHAAAVGLLDQTLQKIISMDAAVRPTRVHTDVEPHTLADWEKNKPQYCTQLVVLAQKLRARLDLYADQSGAFVALNMAVAFWYIDGEPPALTTGGAQLGHALLDAGVDVDVMNFRKSYQWTESTAAPWITAASQRGRLAWIGLETNKLNPPEDAVTYFAKMPSLEGDISKLSAKFKTQPGFATIALQDANGFAANGKLT
jgi:hypothetical protein